MYITYRKKMEVLTKYDVNKECIKRYYKKRYNTDEEFRTREKDRMLSIHRYKYVNDENYREQWKEYSRINRLKSKVNKLKDVGNIEKLKEMLINVDKLSKDYVIIHNALY